jgi:hypothetical protein
MKFPLSLLALGFLPQFLSAQIPSPIIPDCVGVNIHFITGHTLDLDLITNAGFKFVRMDFTWEGTEAKAGVYNWAPYDELTANLDQRGLSAIYILDYANALYEPMVESHHPVGDKMPEQHLASPRHPESVAAFGRWAAAAATHFHGRHILWELYNEPNGGFWRPKPDVAEYTTMALAAAKAIRGAQPSATIIGPALATFDWKFIEYFLKSGVLEYIDGVSVHPYRSGSKPPETAAANYKKLRGMIDQNAPESRRGKIPILSGEWGYPSDTKGVSLETQAAYAVRQQLSNLLNGIPLSIWYDLNNDGPNPADPEHNFGLMTSDLQPKPAYTALKTMMTELNGYRLEQRMDVATTNDFALVFVNNTDARKVAVWTLAAPRTISLGGSMGSLQVGPMPQYLKMK